MKTIKVIRNLSLAALLFVATSLLCAQKVKIGYDKQNDFSKYKTYAWSDREIVGSRRLLVMHIMGSIEEELNKKGLQKVATDADLLIHVSGGLNPQSGGATVSDPTYALYGGYPPPGTTVWSGTAPAAPGTAFGEGRLVIDLLDPRRKLLVWQATGKVNVDPEQKREALGHLNKTITKMFDKYPLEKYPPVQKN
jgi:hypothetical protein